METNATSIVAAAGTGGRRQVEQHSMGRSVFLHLLPGALVTLFFVLFGPVAERWGAPALMAIFIGAALIVVPFELGYLLREGRRKNGRLSLDGVVLYRHRLPLWHYFVLVPGGLAWMMLVFFVATRPIDAFLIDRLFSWLPEWFFGAARSLEQYPRPALLAMAVLALAVNGVAAPIVEELYFRGYLLPRISRLGNWAPIVSSVLFSLYHFFTPWQNPARLLVLIPFTYVLRWNRNIYWGMIVHVSLNTIAMVMVFAAIL